MEPVTPPQPPYHDVLYDINICCSFRGSSSTHANPRDLELPSDAAWTDVDDGFRPSSPKPRYGANPSSSDALEPMVSRETSCSTHQSLGDRPGDFNAFLSGFSSGVDAGRITGYTECLHVCLADLLSLAQCFPADGPQVGAHDCNEHVDYGRQSSEALSTVVLTLPDDDIMSLFVGDDNFPQDEIGQSLALGDGNYTQQGECPDDLMASLWPLDSPSSDCKLGTQQGECPDDLLASLWPLDSLSSDCELGTQQGECPDDLMASLWPLNSPSSDCELGTQQGECSDELTEDLPPLDPSSGDSELDAQQGECSGDLMEGLGLLDPPSSDCELGKQRGGCPDDLMEDLPPLDPPSGGGRSKSSVAAACIDLTGSDDEDDASLYPSQGGGGNNSPATVMCIDLTGSEDKHEFTELDEDDEFPPLHVLLQRIRHLRDRQVT